jgi:hypothetical protein
MIALANATLGISAVIAGSLAADAFWLFCGCVVVMGMSGMGMGGMGMNMSGMQFK